MQRKTKPHKKVFGIETKTSLQTSFEFHQLYLIWSYHCCDLMYGRDFAWKTTRRSLLKRMTLGGKGTTELCSTVTSLEREDAGQELVASSLTIIKQISKSKFSQPATQICLPSPYCTKSLWSQLKPWLALIWFYFLHYIWTSLYLTA